MVKRNLKKICVEIDVRNPIFYEINLTRQYKCNINNKTIIIYFSIYIIMNIIEQIILQR